MPYSIIVDLSHREKIEEFPEFSMGDDEFEVDYIDKNEGPIDHDLLGMKVLLITIYLETMMFYL